MNQETAKNLFEYRKANGYSQEELALKIGAFTESEKSLKGEGYTTYERAEQALNLNQSAVI